MHHTRAASSKGYTYVRIQIGIRCTVGYAIGGILETLLTLFYI